MNRRFFIGLFLLGLLVALAAAIFERAPGYMDADYYYAGALRIVRGQGTSEPYLWNYLNDPQSLTAPAFAYWMPLTSLVGAAGLSMSRSLGFGGARAGFILLAACIPPLTAWFAYRLTGKLMHARLAGILALFPGFYLPYLPTTDSFPIIMVLGTLFLMLASGSLPSRWPEPARMLGLGLLAGLLHMTRADGLLWLAGALLAAWLAARQKRDLRAPVDWRRLVVLCADIAAGYALVAWPWYARNLRVWGSLFPPGSSRAMWITEYEQTMAFPASALTPQRWLAAGWSNHIQDWLVGLSNTLQTSLAVQGQIVLFPFILIGAWRLRRCPAVRLGAVMWLMTAGIMALVFPLAGMNGGFLHSGAAFQPLFWALAPAGVEAAAGWYIARRGLENPRRLAVFLTVVLVVTGALLSGLLYFQKVKGSAAGEWKWNASDAHYRVVEQALAGQGAQAGEPVLVNNPPGFWLASGRPAAVIPYGDEQVLLSAARKYQIRYVVLEVTNPYQLADLYHGQVKPPELEYLSSVGSTRLYRVHLPGN